MDIRRKVREGLSEFLESDESANFKSLTGAEEIVKLAMSDDKFIDAIIEGSKKYDSYNLVFTKYPTEEGISTFIDKLDEIAEENGNTYSPLVNAYIEDPTMVITQLKDNNIEAINVTFAQYNQPQEDPNKAFKELMPEAIVLSSSENPEDSIVATLDMDNPNFKDAVSGEDFIVSDISNPNIQQQAMATPQLRTP